MPLNPLRSCQPLFMNFDYRFEPFTCNVCCQMLDGLEVVEMTSTTIGHNNDVWGQHSVVEFIKCFTGARIPFFLNVNCNIFGYKLKWRMFYS